MPVSLGPHSTKERSARTLNLPRKHAGGLFGRQRRGFLFARSRRGSTWHTVEKASGQRHSSLHSLSIPCTGATVLASFCSRSMSRILALDSSPMRHDDARPGAGGSGQRSGSTTGSGFTLPMQGSSRLNGNNGDGPPASHASSSATAQGSTSDRFAQSMGRGSAGSSFARTDFRTHSTSPTLWSEQQQQQRPHGNGAAAAYTGARSAIRPLNGSSRSSAAASVRTASGESSRSSSVHANHKRALSISSGSDLSDAPSPPSKKKSSPPSPAQPAPSSPPKARPPASQLLPPTSAASKSKSKPKSIDISDDEVEEGGGAGSAVEFDEDESDSERERLNETKAVQWFNNAEDKQLMDVIGITEKQAQTITGLRPFSNGEKIRAKLRNADGVRPKMFDDCVECLHGLHQIDAVLAKCEKLGKRLASAFELAGVGAPTAQTIGQDSGRQSSVRDNHAPVSRGVGEGEQPEGLTEGIVLKDFQLRGLNWLWLLFERGCSGILADDMGLGKTAQVISFLNLAVRRLDRRPHLIVVPSSVLDNWLREFKTFGPELRVFKYHGKQNERAEQRMDLREDRTAYDVVITTYDMATGGTSGADKDHTFLRKYGFDACIFDEGHILKNRKSLKYTKLLRIRAQWRLILTGTPLQNNLSELISLLQFIMPTYFRGAEDALTQIFQVKQAGQLSEERVTRAKQMMQPFVLRRRKIDVLDDLQPKREVIKYCEMTTRQSEVYREIFAKSRTALLEQQRHNEETDNKVSGKKAGGRGSKASTPTTSAVAKAGHVLIDLRKAANHPLLFRRIYEGPKIESLVRDYRKTGDFGGEPLAHTKEDFETNCDAELAMSIAMPYKECAKHVLPDTEWLDSGKILALRDVIEEAKVQGERVIVFSQFVLTLEVICRALEVLGITYRGFTGSTDVNHRQKLVDEFTNDDSISCFLLSTRAGGVGINLMAANWVVLYDQDYNPQNDQQAADRCYRIGQTKPVTIVRLLSKGTIDEQIYALGKRKLKLAQRVQGENAGTVATGTQDGKDEDEGEDEASGADSADKRDKHVEQALLASLVNGTDVTSAVATPEAA